MRAIWQGSLTFGLVEIPVALLSAERERGLELRMLDRRDKSPIGYSRYNKTTREEVPWEEIVRGYEFEKGRYVVLSDEDLAAANPEATRTVDIVRFVDRASIEPIHYETPYYLGPLKKKSKGYVLLRETLVRSDVVGIARIVLRTRERMAAVGVREGVLVLQLLRYPDEIRPPNEVENADVEPKDVGVTPKEIELARKLVEGMTEEWDPSAYRDTYREDVLAMIEKKIASGKIDEPLEAGEVREPRGGGTVIDLMPLLKQSLAARSRGASRGGPPAAARRKRAPAQRGRKRRDAG